MVSGFEKDDIYLFDLQIGPWQVQPLRIGEDQGVMNERVLNIPQKLQDWNLNIWCFSVICEDARFEEEVLPLCRDAFDIFYRPSDSSI